MTHIYDANLQIHTQVTSHTKSDIDITKGILLVQVINTKTYLNTLFKFLSVL